VDIQRIILILGMAVTSYLLVLAWNEDYHQRPTNSAVEMQEAAVVASDYEAAINTIPEKTADELPGIELDAEVPQVDKPVSADRELVKVSTDVLHVWIDTRGGDFTRIDLPGFPQNINSPDLPYILVDPRNNYVAQSGLIGPQGPDAKQGRTVYSVHRKNYEMLESDDQLLVDLTFIDEDSVEVIKRFTFQRGSYLIGVEFLINNTSSETWSSNLFAQIKRDAQSPAIEEENSMGLRPYVG
jgi:YidC/Oxa1 family membrane protein insertase